MGFIAICHHCNMPSQRALLCKPKNSKLTRQMDIVMFTCVAPTRRMDIVMSTCVAPTRRMDIVMNPYGLANKHSDWGLSPVSCKRIRSGAAPKTVARPIPMDLFLWPVSSSSATIPMDFLFLGHYSYGPMAYSYGPFPLPVPLFLWSYGLFL